MSTVAPLNAMGRCQLCQQMRAVRNVSFHRNVGMLVRRRMHSIHADLCKTCIHRKFWEFQGKNLLWGPWGYFSLLLTPILLLQNTVTYLIALYKLRDAME
jgi:hypothetical protein